ncbi:5'-nucleotidase C-terminal domain-containing protein [Paenibacillus sp. 7541]|uniref:5'-nucleotidase C-terminal domain-containing protein n=1 Tax=Paenibacillus sp. 7541 TaxID=2026236 RepID=UPI000BA77BA5|nr:5'-nucleotidase C-terminal domain-containing protein [Paenibacillus sp. 7541]PAK54928.1 bifunctional metallophosphatase/5'-nucleotidase [Paenibacillus sp. 7541]
MNVFKRPLCKLLIAALLVVGLLPAGTGSVFAAEGEAQGFELRILHTNDTHAHLDNVARRVTAVNEARNDSTLLLDAGDVFSGTLYFNQYNGLADLYFMNLMKYDAMTFGNHEFDRGPEVLAEFVKEAKFPFVSSNVDFSAEPALNGFTNEEIGTPGNAGEIYPALIKEVKGEKVGIIGLTTPETAVLASPGDHIKFEYEVEAAQKQVNALEAAGVNKIIAVTHLGYAEDRKLAKAVKGLDVIVGGHSHTKLDQAEVFHADAEPTLIVQTGEYNVNLGQLDVTFDENGVLTDWDYKLINLDAKDDEGNFLIQGDAAAEAKVQEYAAALEELKKTVVASSEVELDGERSNVRTQETNLGNLIADGMRAKVMSLVQEDDVKGYVTIQNAGGIRASIPAGDITLGHLLTTMPFANNLSALKMTGAEIAAALENGISGVENGEGRFPQVSGMRFYYDSTKQGEQIDAVSGSVTQQGERIVKVQIQNADGTYTDMEPNAYYIVATNSYMADGGDFYRAMKQAKDADRFYELNIVDYEIFREYLEQLDVVDAAVEGRSIDLKGAALPGEAGGATDGAAGESVFKDLVNDKDADAIQAAADAGLVNGYQDGTFRPDQAVTRAEFAVLVSRAFDIAGSAASAGYADESSIPAWALPAVASLKEAGLLETLAGSSFGPKQTLTAAEAAAIIAAAAGDEAAAAPAGDGAVTRRDVVLMLVSAIQ